MAMPPQLLAALEKSRGGGKPNPLQAAAAARVASKVAPKKKGGKFTPKVTNPLPEDEM